MRDEKDRSFYRLTLLLFMPIRLVAAASLSFTKEEAIALVIFGLLFAYLWVYVLAMALFKMFMAFLFKIKPFYKMAGFIVVMQIILVACAYGLTYAIGTGGGSLARIFFGNIIFYCVFLLTLGGVVEYLLLRYAFLRNTNQNKLKYVLTTRAVMILVCVGTILFSLYLGA